VQRAPLADHYFYTGRVKFNEKAFAEAHAAFERLLPNAEGLDLVLLRGLAELSLAFELIRGRRMLDPGYLALQAARAALEEVPVSELQGIQLGPLRAAIAAWLDYLHTLGDTGLRASPPPLPQI